MATLAFEHQYDSSRSLSKSSSPYCHWPTCFDPLDALRKEANVNSYSTTSKQLILKARGKALQNTDDHLKRIALNAHVP